MTAVLGDSDGDSLGDTDGLALGDPDGDVDGDSLGLTLGDSDADGERDGDSLGLALGDELGLRLGDADGDALGEADGLRLGDTDGDMVADLANYYSSKYLHPRAFNHSWLQSSYLPGQSLQNGGLVSCIVHCPSLYTGHGDGISANFPDMWPPCTFSHSMSCLNCHGSNT